MMLFFQRAADEKLHREVVDALGVGLFTRQPRLDPAVGNEVANEPGNRFETLPRTGRDRVDHVLAEQIAIGPIILVTGQTQSFQPAVECLASRMRIIGDVRHALVLAFLGSGCTPTQERRERASYPLRINGL